MLAHSITALSKHRRPRDLFHTFVTLFKISWMQQLLLFCCVALKRSWYRRCCTDTNDCIGCCKSVNCPVVGGDLEEWKGEDINLRELCPHLHFPLFFFSTAGPSLLRNLGGSCSLFSSLQINTPLFSEFFLSLLKHLNPWLSLAFFSYCFKSILASVFLILLI